MSARFVKASMVSSSPSSASARPKRYLQRESARLESERAMHPQTTANRATALPSFGSMHDRAARRPGSPTPTQLWTPPRWNRRLTGPLLCVRQCAHLLPHRESRGNCFQWFESRCEADPRRNCHKASEAQRRQAPPRTNLGCAAIPENASAHPGKRSYDWRVRSRDAVRMLWIGQAPPEFGAHLYYGDASSKTVPKEMHCR